MYTLGDCVFFFNDTATTEIYTLSLHDALPILTPNKHLRTRSGTALAAPARNERYRAGDRRVAREVAGRLSQQASRSGARRVATASLSAAGAPRLIGRARKNRRGTRSLHPWKGQREESHQLCPRRRSWRFLEGPGGELPQTCVPGARQPRFDRSANPATSPQRHARSARAPSPFSDCRF